MCIRDSATPAPARGAIARRHRDVTRGRYQPCAVADVGVASATSRRVVAATARGALDFHPSRRSRTSGVHALLIIRSSSMMRAAARRTMRSDARRGRARTRGCARAGAKCGESRARTPSTHTAIGVIVPPKSSDRDSRHRAVIKNGHTGRSPSRAIARARRASRAHSRALASRWRT